MERIARVVLGVGLAVVGFGLFGTSVKALIFAAFGAGAIITGVIGFCPACALIGRRLLHPGER